MATAKSAHGSHSSTSNLFIASADRMMRDWKLHQVTITWRKGSHHKILLWCSTPLSTKKWEPLENRKIISLSKAEMMEHLDSCLSESTNCRSKQNTPGMQSHSGCSMSAFGVFPNHRPIDIQYLKNRKISAWGSHSRGVAVSIDLQPTGLLPNPSTNLTSYISSYPTIKMD